MSNIELRQDQGFAVHVRGEASAILVRALGKEQGAGKAATVAAAFQSAAEFQNVTSKRDALKLYDCTPESVARAIAVCVMADVMPGGSHPEVYLIPKRINGTPTMQAWLSPIGLRKAARRAGYLVQEFPVYEGQEQATAEAVQTVASGGVYVRPPVKAEPPLVALVGYYAVVRSLSNPADVVVEYLPREELDRRRDADRAGGGPVWKSWPRMMYRKTILKFVFARGLVPTSHEFRQATEMERAQEVSVKAPSPKAASVAAQLGLPPDDAIDAEVMDPEPSALDAFRLELARIGEPRFLAVTEGASPEEAATWPGDAIDRTLADLAAVS